MLKEKFCGVALAIVLLLPQINNASAATVGIVTGGSTTVELTAPLEGLGLKAFGFGSATLDDALFTFPISGGSADELGNLKIEHDGSGVTLQAIVDPTVTATVANFVVDTSTQAVFGDLVGGASDLKLFDFGSTEPAGIPLLISTTLAGALTSVFGAPDLKGAQFGYASTEPQLSPVPLPAGLPFLAFGVALLFGLGRNKRV